MTVIVADTRSGLMVSDSQWSDGEQTGATKKVFRIRGDLIGFAGALGEIRDTVAWFKGGRVGKPPVGSVQAVILRRNKILLWSNTDGEVEERAPFFAIGTGGAAARGALLSGADAVTAARVATQVDADSGGRIRIYRAKGF